MYHVSVRMLFVTAKVKENAPALRGEKGGEREVRSAMKGQWEKRV